MDLAHIAHILQSDCSLASGACLVVGVSAGPDSLCLLDSLARLGFAVHAAHFDHQLRPESGQDAAVARRVAADLGVPFHLGSADVAAAARMEGLSLEEAARNLRYRFLFATARAVGAAAVAVGHHADDQVETVLMHFLRGTGLSGLTGMGYCTLLPFFDSDVPVVRPLLNVWRAEVLAYCTVRNLPFVTDASNHDQTFFRNRLRHDLLPRLAEDNPQIRPAIWRMAQILAGDAQLLQQAQQAAWQACVRSTLPGQVHFDLQCLRSCLLPMQRRLVRMAAAYLRPELRDLDFETVNRAVDFIAKPARSKQMELAQHLCLLIEPGQDGEQLLLLDEALPTVQAAQAWPQMAVELVEVALPGAVEIAPGWVLRAEMTALNAFVVPHTNHPWQAWLDGEACAAGLLVRVGRAGERFQPLGMLGKTVKLSDFWINQKLPRRARARWPLVCCADQIAWLPGYRLGHAFRVTTSTRELIHLTLEGHLTE